MSVCVYISVKYDFEKERSFKPELRQSGTKGLKCFNCLHESKLQNVDRVAQWDKLVQTNYSNKIQFVSHSIFASQPPHAPGV